MKFSTLLLALILLNLAFTWPWEAQQKELSSEAPEPPKTQMEQKKVEPIPQKLSQEKEDQSVTNLSAEPVTVPSVVVPPAVKVINPPIQRIRPPIQTTVKPVITPQAVSEAQRQVNEIIALNQSLELRQMNQMAEVRRIIDQAKIHQKILSDLQKVPRLEKPKVASSEELLRQEKIRLIVSETSRNKETIKKIEEEYRKEIEKNDKQSQAKSKSEE